ncbi:MAG: acetylglutamate kinase, partial [Bacteroidales bacterium]|nr:acetylglutamate kinase [Bacteroidales bacterium]
MEQLKVIKVGGKIVEETDTLNILLNDYAKVEGRKILVHGGGRSATKISAQLGIETQMIDGRRVTDAETLKVVTMVYAGLVNKTIVASLQSRGINAIGVCGADAGIILSNKRPAAPIDYGYVGDVVKVDGEMLASLLQGGTYPVVAPITHDGNGNLLNTNADTIASEVAKGVAEKFDVTLIYCFEKPGVLMDENDDNSVIPLINREKFEELKATGIVSGGMLPKLQSAFKALEAGVKEVVITHASAIDNP